METGLAYVTPGASPPPRAGVGDATGGVAAEVPLSEEGGGKARSSGREEDGTRTAPSFGRIICQSVARQDIVVMVGPRRRGRGKAARRASSCPAKSWPTARGTWGECSGIHLCGCDAPGAFFTVDGAGVPHYLVRPHRSGKGAAAGILQAPRAHEHHAGQHAPDPDRRTPGPPRRADAALGRSAVQAGRGTGVTRSRIPRFSSPPARPHHSAGRVSFHRRADVLQGHHLSACTPPRWRAAPRGRSAT